MIDRIEKIIGELRDTHKRQTKLSRVNEANETSELRISDLQNQSDDFRTVKNDD